MPWMLYDSSGRRYGSFDDVADACDALVSVAHEHPDLADELMLLEYGSDGEPIGEGVMLEDLLAGGPDHSAPNGRPDHVWAAFQFTAGPVVADRLDEPLPA